MDSCLLHAPHCHLTQRYKVSQRYCRYLFGEEKRPQPRPSLTKQQPKEDIGVVMFSFFQQLANTDGSHRQEADKSTSGESAFVYLGGHHTPVPKDTTRIRVARSAKHLDGRVNYGNIFSLELPNSVLTMDANLTAQGTSCLAPSKIVQAMQNKIASYKALDVFKSDDMRSLRNVAFPSNLSDKDLPTFGTNSDLGKVLPAKRNSEYLYR